MRVDEDKADAGSGQNANAKGGEDDKWRTQMLMLIAAEIWSTFMHRDIYLTQTTPVRRSKIDMSTVIMRPAISSQS